MLPSRRADMKQRLASNVQLASCDSNALEQSCISEPVTASDYEFSDQALVDKKVSCCGIVDNIYRPLWRLCRAMSHLWCVFAEANLGKIQNDL